MKFSSLKTKVLIWFIGTITIVLFSFSFLLYYFIEEIINLKIQNNMYYSAKDMHDEIVENKLHEITFKYEKANGIAAAIIQNDKIIKKSEDFTIKNLSEYINKDQIFFSNESSNETVDAIYVLNFETPYKGSIVLHKKGLPNKAEDIEEILFVLNPIFLIVLIFIGIKLIDKILIPIKNITQTAKQINIDNLTQNISTDQKEDELKELAFTFNDMVKRLREGIEKMERFNNDVSHELRTPLTVISTQIELALKKDREKEYYKNSLEKIDDESKKMKHMVQDMLILTKYTKDNIEETFCLCDLNSILMNCIEKFVFFADKKNISIEVKKFEKTLLKANSSLITILFSNLLDNAIKYSLENKKIFLSLFEENGRIIFIIKDEGIGIPKELLPKITDKFYRVDESRNKSIKGFGLGLSIVKNIIELHNGNMNIGSKESVGTTVLITFEANLEHINVRNS